MATLIKIVLAFSFLIFLVGNSKAATFENDEYIFNGNGLHSGPYYTLSIHCKNDSPNIQIRFNPLVLNT